MDLATSNPTRSAPRKSGSVPCATCGKDVDPLRAARVSHHRDRFRYFCSSECRERFDVSATGTPLPVSENELRAALGFGAEPSARPVEPARVSAAPPAAAPAHADGQGDAESAANGARALAEPLGEVAEVASGEEPEPPSLLLRADDSALPIDAGAVLLSLALLGSVLSVVLALTGDSPLALTARLIVTMVSGVSLAAESLLGTRSPTEIHPLALLAAPLGSIVVATSARVLSEPRTASAITLSGLIIACAAVATVAIRRARRPLDVERQRIALAFEHPCHRVVGNDVLEARASDLRPGEEIVVEAGEFVPVDATVTAGSAELLPWLGAVTPATRREGDSIVGGAQVLQGRLRAVVTWAGHDRAFMRLTNDPRRRADLFAPLARLGKITAERIAPFVAGFAALAAFAGNTDAFQILLVTVAVLAAVAQAGIAETSSLAVARGVLQALRRGIVFRSADAFERTGRVSTVAFCARGTLLLGEPEVANVEAFGGLDAEQVLALISGAESGASHPVATAVLRAARARGVRPDGVRSPNNEPGLGVTAVASSGQALVVGTRGLMLRERISVAAAESRISDLETMGRSVLLAALGGRLVGLLGLQDGLRPGARAAVQHLLDVNVEPVLLSGDARDTCEAIGRALDIDHLRPEVAPSERGDEVRRLGDGGAVVAVIGRSPGDDAALTAADVSIALSSSSASAAEWSVQLASEDVRDAAYAVRLAHDSRRDAQIGLFFALGPALVAAVALALALLPPAVAPLFALAGTLLSLLPRRG